VDKNFYVGCYRQTVYVIGIHMTTDTYGTEMRRIIGANVWRLRDEAKLSRQQFAEKVGTTRAVIYEIENETKSPSLEMLEKIAHAFSRLFKKEITVADLVTKPKTKRGDADQEPAGAHHK